MEVDNEDPSVNHVKRQTPLLEVASMDMCGPPIRESDMKLSLGADMG